MLLPITLDLRERAALSKLPESLPRDFVDVDVLVNNAGLALGLEPAYRAHLDDWQTMIERISAAWCILPMPFCQGWCNVIEAISST